MSIAAAYYAGKVLRWHSNPAVSVVRQTNADHVAGCLTLLFMLVPEPSIDLVRAITFHDHGERWTGDLSNTFKSAHPEAASRHADIETYYTARVAGRPIYTPLTGDELGFLKLVDRLEAFSHVATFFPQELNHDDWGGYVDGILNLSAELGVNKEVSTFIGDMKQRRFDLEAM